MATQGPFRLEPPPHFDFRSVIHSHGWWRLPPFQYDETKRALSRVDRLASGRLLRYTLVEEDGALFLWLEEGLNAAEETELRAIVARILSWELDLAPFYEYLSNHPDYAWVLLRALGRKLKAATVWEDAVKTLLTTNTNWAMTIQMATRLAGLGSRLGERQAFPTPAELVTLGEEAVADAVRAGYRNAYLFELATRLAGGELDLEAWLADDGDDETLYRRLRSLKGFGDYAVSSLMRIYGRYGYLCIDSIARSCHRALHPKSEDLSARALDAAIRAHYTPHGKWQALVQWMDVTRAHEEGLVS